MSKEHICRTYHVSYVGKTFWPGLGLLKKINSAAKDFITTVYITIYGKVTSVLAFHANRYAVTILTLLCCQT